MQTLSSEIIKVDTNVYATRQEQHPVVVIMLDSSPVKSTNVVVGSFGELGLSHLPPPDLALARSSVTTATISATSLAYSSAVVPQNDPPLRIQSAICSTVRLQRTCRLIVQAHGRSLRRFASLNTPDCIAS
jgi:hypothetical protein